MVTDVIYDKSFFGMDEIKNESVRLIFADPPYNISNMKNKKNNWCGYTSNKGTWDKLEDPELFAGELIQGAQRVLLEGGIICISGVYGSLIPYWKSLTIRNFEFLHHIVWHKTNPAPSLHRRSLTYSNEIIIVFKKPGKHVFNYEIAKTYNNGKQLHDVWNISSVKKQWGLTRKPSQLLERFIKIFSNENDLILDPCCGTGTTCEVARNLKRRFVGYEINRDICYKLENEKEFEIC